MERELIRQRINTGNEVSEISQSRILCRFRDEVIEEWDKGGEGIFSLFVVRGVSQKWLEMERSN